MPMKTFTILAVLLAASYAAGDDTRPTTQPTTQPSNRSLSAEQVLSRMLRPSGGAATRPLQAPGDSLTADKTSGSGAVAPNAPVVNVMREGSYIVDRVGRLTRSADGSQPELTFDSDGKSLRDPPVFILPNLKLMAMETAVGIANRDLKFRVTGVVTEYHGRNYVLLEKVVVVPDAVQQF